MYLLAIDTATNSGGVALSRNSEVIGLVMCKTPMRYSDRLIGYTDYLLSQLDVEVGEIDCFVVAKGPGSFTGLRIGIATTKGFCLAQGKPAIGISTLEALAWRFRWASHHIAPMIDARRQQIYGALFGSDLNLIRKGNVASPSKWLRSLPKTPCVYVGDAAQMYRQTVSSIHPEGKVLSTDNCILRQLCELGYRRFARGKTCSGAELRAEYIRPSDAELSE
jgi:tRNA threonylcarbamoyladenosine biosynthesis protein TsaB